MPPCALPKIILLGLGIFALIMFGSTLIQAQDLLVDSNNSPYTITTSVGFDNTYVGSNATDSNNLLAVTGGSAVLSNSASIYLGYDGSANSLAISNGAAVAVNGNSFIGVNSTASNNRVVVTGAGSTWSNNGNLDVGYFGASNGMVISNGGVVTVNGWTTVGNQPGSSNNMLGITGSGSTLTAYNEIFMGGNYNSSTDYSGSPASVQNQVVVSEGGVINSSGSMYVGFNGSLNSLVISNGGNVTNEGASIGIYASSSNNSVLVSGLGSLWSIANSLELGVNGGFFNSLVISNKGAVANNIGYIGYGNDSFSNSVTVTGADSTWSNGGSVYVGYDASASSLVISNGGSVSSANNCEIGHTSSNNSISVDGVGTSLSIGGELRIGYYGSSNAVFVTNGANVSIGGWTLVGEWSGASNNLLKVSGSSTLTSAGEIDIGYDNNTSGNQVIVTGGGELITRSYLVVGQGGSSNSLVVSNGGRAVSDGVFFIGHFSSASNNSVLVTGSNSSINANSGLYVGASGSGTLTITAGGAVVASRIDIAYDTGSVGVLNIGSYGGTDTAGTLTTPSIVFGSGSGTINLNQVNEFTLGADISGPGSLNQFGTGTTTISGNNSYTGGTTINAGRVITTANTALGTGSVALNNGTLEVRSLLTIADITWSGGQIALPTLTSANGIYVVSTNGLTLSGGGTFNLRGASLTRGVPTPLLGATNMSTNNFSTNDFSVNGVSKYALSISNDILWIDWLGGGVPTKAAYPNFVIPGLTPNQRQVAQALNTWASENPSGDKAIVLGALTNIPSSQWAAAFDQMSPRFYQQMATIAFNLANAQYNELVQRLYGLRVAGTGFSMNGFNDNTMVLEGQGDGDKNPKNDILRPGLDSHWGMFVDGNGIFGSANSANMLPGYNFQSGGITTGLTYKWNESFGTGLYAGYQGAYAKNNGLGTLIDNAVKFGLFGAYGTPDGKGLYADGLIGGGYNNYQVSRSIQFGSINRTANSSPGAGELDSMLAAGYNWRKGNWSFGPVGSFQYTYFGMNGFNETGAQSLNLNSQGWSSSSMVSSLGGNCAYSWQAKPKLMVVPQINLAWQHEYLQNPYAINSTMSGTPFANWSATPNRDTLYTGVGVTLEYGKKWNTAFFYNAAAGNQNITSQNIFWSAGVKF